MPSRCNLRCDGVDFRSNEIEQWCGVGSASRIHHTPLPCIVVLMFASHPHRGYVIRAGSRAPFVFRTVVSPAFRSLVSQLSFEILPGRSNRRRISLYTSSFWPCLITDCWPSVLCQWWLTVNNPVQHANILIVTHLFKPYVNLIVEHGIGTNCWTESATNVPNNP